MSGWSEWADNLARLRLNYQRPQAYGMVTDDELAFLEHYARWSYTGEGRITDLGCWLGATTLALARGLAQNPVAGRSPPIEAIDRFIWEEWMTPIARAMGIRSEHAPGESFLEETEAVLAPYRALVTLTRADLAKRVPGNAPIEFLFIDAMKSWKLANAIARNFFPRLIPGRSLVVQQDFGYHHPVGATNHLLMWHVRDFFEPVHHVPGSCSVVFFHTRPITRQDLPTLDPRRITESQVEAAWAHSLRALSPNLHGAARLCKAMFMVERGWEEAALVEARRLEAEGWRWDPVTLGDVRQILAQRRSELAPGSIAARRLEEIGGALRA